MSGTDPDHWLHRFSAREWLSAAQGEMERAAAAYKVNDARGGMAGARRAAGMALNAALVVEPDDSWGRTYMEHLAAVAKQETLPEAVREAARALIEARAPGTSVIGLRSRAGDDRILEAARDLMAHAYSRMIHHEPDPS